MTTVIDLSGGDQHLRDIAEESGIDWIAYHSNEEVSAITIDDFGTVTIDTWYNEDCGSPWSAWGAFCRGYGSAHGASREEAIENLVTLILRIAAQ